MATREPLLVVEYNDPFVDAKGWLVIDSLVNSAAGGGVRISRQVERELVTQLAQTMALKFTVFEPHIGGAKSGIRFPHEDPEKKMQVLRRFVAAIKPYLATHYGTGGDENVSEEEIIAVVEQEKLRHPQEGIVMALAERGVIADPDQAIERLRVGTMRLTLNGFTLPELATGYGVVGATIETLNFFGESLKGKTVAIQGFGVVGGGAAKFFYENGAKVVAANDEHMAIYCADGLDIPTLIAKRVGGKRLIDRDQLPGAYQQLERDALLSLAVDIFVPAAGSNLLTRENEGQVQARLIVEGANDPITNDAEEQLNARGVTIVPDFVANAGVAGLFGVLMLGKDTEGRPLPMESQAILNTIAAQIRRATRALLVRHREKRISPRQAAEEIAWEKIKQAQVKG